MQRLKTRPQFQAALAGGTVSRTAHFALHRLSLTAPTTSLAQADSIGPAPSPEQALFDLPDVWLGAMVPKRWARRAVTRNTIKRQIYTVAQEFADRLPVAAHIVRPASSPSMQSQSAWPPQTTTLARHKQAFAVRTFR